MSTRRLASTMAELSEKATCSGGSIKANMDEEKADPNPCVSESEDDDDEDIFEVEKIVGISKIDGKEMYKVRWKGYGPSYDTWEPYDNLMSCVDMIDEFKKLQQEKMKKKKDEAIKRRVSEKKKSPAAKGPKFEYIEDDETTLKDTFWEDLKDGKINVFDCDMYSKVKGRAARPTNLKEGGMKDEEIGLSDGDTKSEPKPEPKRKRIGDKGTSVKKKQRKSVDNKSPPKKDTEKKSDKMDSPVSEQIPKQFSDTKLDDVTSQTKNLSEKSGIQEEKEAQPPSTSVPQTLAESSVSKVINTSSSDKKSAPVGKSEKIKKLVKTDDSSSNSSTITDVSVPDLELPTFIKKTKTVSANVAKPTKDVDKSSNNGSTAKSGTNKSRSSSGGLFSAFMTTGSSYSSDSAPIGDKTEKIKSEKQSSSKPLISKKALDSVKNMSFSKHRSKTERKSVDGTKDTKDRPPLVLKLSTSNCSSAVEQTTVVPSKKDKLPKEKKKTHSFISKEEKPLKDADKSMKDSNAKNNGSVTPSVQNNDKKGGKIEKRSNSTISKLETSGKTKDIGKDCKMDPFVETNLDSLKTTTTNLFDLVDNDDRDYESFKYELEDVDIDEWDRLETERISQKLPPIELTNSEFKYAVKSGDYMKVEQALRGGCSQNLENIDNTGMTFMMIAAQQGYDDIIEALSVNGAHVNAQQKNGMTALMHACEHGHVCTVSLLLQLGSHVNCVHSSTGETALMKAIRRGYKQITKLLLDQGANFAANGPNEMTAAKLAKLMKNQEIHDMIIGHIKKLSATFENQVNLVANNAVKLLHPLFPIQCLAIGESELVYVHFKHELQPTVPAVGTLLFLAHARIVGPEMKCRFQGSCAVKSVVLNGVVQAPLTEEGNFVMTFSPLHNGKNELRIVLAQAQNVRVKLVVCAYKAHLTIPMPVC